MAEHKNWQYVHDENGKRLVANFQDYNCNIIMERYQKGSLSLRLVDTVDQCPVCRATSNLIDVAPKPNEVLIKNYAENHGVLQALVDSGLASDTGKTVDTGHAQLNICHISSLLAQQWESFQAQLPDLPNLDTERRR